jgi:hypothetical protein
MVEMGVVDAVALLCLGGSEHVVVVCRRADDGSRAVVVRSEGGRPGIFICDVARHSEQSGAVGTRSVASDVVTDDIGDGWVTDGFGAMWDKLGDVE